uniref:Uncharacterized protein n=1 Tax=Oryza sativa subsp. japonica TaxID=39947 RepID=Q338D3_ORYSJ|nr:hypothetical protein LOC_Os10g27310 [Oryza sativa Japonica Group]
MAGFVAPGGGLPGTASGRRGGGSVGGWSGGVAEEAAAWPCLQWQAVAVARSDRSAGAGGGCGGGGGCGAGGVCGGW